MKTAAVVLGLFLALIALDACKPARKQLRRARETHRSAAARPLSTPPSSRGGPRGHLDLR